MITIHEIAEIVANEFDVSLKDLRGRCKMKCFSWPRQAAYFLAKKHANAPTPKIGAVFGGRDHSTIIYGIEAVENRDDQEFKRSLEQAELKIRYYREWQFSTTRRPEFKSVRAAR